MIDINRAKNAFDEYVKNYNPENGKIRLKISHIKRVASISKDIATELGLSKEDIQLAELIGLLHDIGRFEQVRIYNTFVDKNSINHGQLGAKILFEDGLIRNFVEDNQYDEIIRKAIVNHNRAKIEDGLDERELMHCKIIRDSDKTDIYYVLSVEDTKNCYETGDMTKEKITPEIYKEFIEEHSIDYKKMQSSADILVGHFAYAFDYNYNYGLKILENKGYIDKLYNKFSFNDKVTQDMCDNIYKETKQYIAMKLQEN